MRTKKSLFTAVLAAAGLTFAATSATAALEGCPDSIIVGTEGAYPPFNYIDEAGDLQGFDVDIAEALCEEIGADCEFRTQAWDGIIPGLLAERYDAIIASMSITDERRERVDFTDRYYQTPARFVAHQDMDVEISEEGLSGMVVGVQSATVSENFLRDNFGDVVDVRAYDTQESANLDLVAGRVDLVLADAIILQEGFLADEDGADYEFKGPSFSDQEWFGEGIGIAVRPGEDELRECFNQAIANIRADGTYQEISESHFGMDIYGE